VTRALAAAVAVGLLAGCGSGPRPPSERPYVKTLPDLGPVTGTRAFNDPAALAFAANGDLWVGNREANTLARYAKDQVAPGLRAPVPATVIQGGVIKGPNAMVFGARGYLWVAMYDADRVAAFSPADLAAARPPSVVLPDPKGLLRNPAGVAFDGSGNLWVSNAAVGRLVRYPRRGLEAGTSRPDVVLTVADDDCQAVGVVGARLWLGCSYTDVVYVYDVNARTGRPPWITRIDNSGCGPVQFARAGGSALAVACSRWPSVRGLAGGVPSVTHQSLTGVHGVAFDASGALWAGTSQNVIVRYGGTRDELPDVVLRPRREAVPAWSSAPVGRA